MPCRTTLALLLAAALLNASTGAAEKPSAAPQIAWTGPEGATVYSGPDHSYYPTQRLEAGEQVAVYREHAGGWMAIRPPQGSFSRVAVRDLQLVGSDVARVMRSGAASRVGSLLNDEQDAVHVRLKQGESVRLVGPVSPGQRWCKIAPPAGEFRWVRAEELSGTWPDARGSRSLDGRPAPPSLHEDEVVAAAREEPVATAAPTRPRDPGPSTGDPPPAEDAQQAETPPTPAAQSPNDSPAESPDAGARERAGPDSPDSPDSPDTPDSPDAPDAPAAARRQPLSGSFAQKLDQLEIRLGRIVAEPPNLWTFHDLEREAAQLLTEATSDAQRHAVRSIAERMERFAAVRQRYEQIRTAAAAAAVTPITPLESAQEGDSEYAAVGVLRPVVSKRGNAPPYALVDAQGQVTAFITPSPSLDIQPLLGRKVGVSGTRGYMAEYNRRHVATAQVTPLDGTRTR